MISVLPTKRRTSIDIWVRSSPLTQRKCCWKVNLSLSSLEHESNLFWLALWLIFFYSLVPNLFVKCWDSCVITLAEINDLCFGLWHGSLLLLSLWLESLPPGNDWKETWVLGNPLEMKQQLEWAGICRNKKHQQRKLFNWHSSRAHGPQWLKTLLSILHQEKWCSDWESSSIPLSFCVKYFTPLKSCDHISPKQPEGIHFTSSPSALCWCYLLS